MEDRRPASNFDPYLVTSALVKVIVLGETTLSNPYVIIGEGEKVGEAVRQEVEKVANSLKQIWPFN